MKADKTIRNAKIFTSDKNNPSTSALAVKDGRFAYVDDEAGLSAYEGDVTNLGGRFIMPGINDGHVHVSFPVSFEYLDFGLRIVCNGKQEVLDFMANHIRINPGMKRYTFEMDKKRLKGEDLNKEELDALCPDAELLLREAEGHSVWVNSAVLAHYGITDDTPDPVPGLSYYVRKDGHLTGNIFEGSVEVPVLFGGAMDLSDERTDAAPQRWIDSSVAAGVTGVFGSDFPVFDNDLLTADPQGISHSTPAEVYYCGKRVNNVG